MSRSIDLVHAAAADALAYFATREACLNAAASLEAGEFSAWPADVQRDAARDIRALAAAYHEDPVRTDCGQNWLPVEAVNLARGILEIADEGFTRDSADALRLAELVIALHKCE